MSGAGDSGEKRELVEKATDQELIAVARIAKTRGIRGEVAAELLTDFPERFNGLA
ncbi:MAG: hypothetical protein LC742_11950, partial [Acidobacteria bacterium]|nr:hypothetical protein [Acidobacteriota bacterium]